MEYWRSWIISAVIVLIGMGAKFVLEIYLPEWKKGNVNLKRLSISAFMSLFPLYLIGITVFKMAIKPWSEDLKVFAFFHLFLFCVFVGFLIIMRVFRIFFDDAVKNSDNPEEIQALQKRLFMW